MDFTYIRTEIPDSARQQLYKHAILVVLGGNIVLAGMKGFVAWISGSSAVFSDAANTLADTLYSVLMGIGLYLSQRPADATHPQGHSRFEPFVGIFIALTMGVAGVIAIHQSIQHFFVTFQVNQPGWVTVALGIGGLVKVMMYAYVRRVGEKARSPAIKASAKDNLMDIVISAGALCGVWGSRLIHPFLDPIAGILVALWIFKATWEILGENLGYLTGKGASEELIKKIAEIASAVLGVENVHHVIAEYVGPQLRVDMHINVEGDTPLEQSHAIAEEVRARVESLPEVDLVYVHVEPIE